MNDSYKTIGQRCERCGEDKWYIKDETYLYKMTCMNCYNIICIDKRDYVNKFQCENCGSLSGTLEENAIKLGVRCNNCGKLDIKIEKKTTIDYRDKYQTNLNNTPKCPKCGSTEFTPVRKKWSLLTGFATNKVELICNRCGTKVK